MIYFVRPVGQAGPIKIGFSNDVDARFVGLQSGSPVRLELIATIPGDRSHESLLHYRFSEDRLYGEWFAPSIDLLNLARRNAIEPPRQVVEKKLLRGRLPARLTDLERLWIERIAPIRWASDEEAA